jgi:hypothetical protein
MSGIKVTFNTADDFQVRRRAQLLGMSVNEFCKRAIQRDLVGAADEDQEAVVDKVERGGKAGRAVGAYLSPPLASAIAALARDTERSQSWIVRDLLRTELRRRGLLPAVDDGSVAPAPAATA